MLFFLLLLFLFFSWGVEGEGEGGGIGDLLPCVSLSIGHTRSLCPLHYTTECQQRMKNPPNCTELYRRLFNDTCSKYNPICLQLKTGTCPLVQLPAKDLERDAAQREQQKPVNCSGQKAAAVPSGLADTHDSLKTTRVRKRGVFF